MRGPFRDAYGPHCFYCGTHLPANNPVDHVLPWSPVGIDGPANLVLACARCNGDKSGARPAVSIVDRVLDRDRDVLEQIASEIQWPTQRYRVVAAALGIYRVQPPVRRRGRGTSGASGWISALCRRGGELWCASVSPGFAAVCSPGCYLRPMARGAYAGRTDPHCPV
ncbi:hypothetical protein LAUMK4_00663 [Mycobacterium persicum]|uniref:HNH domain-containing protein n=1 Tax=Mycobacterium persicum TaxID=1487726 RepID=A0ABY6RD27_9MYCO|nr:hypothetical protein A4G31_17445 [Mycobacterium persicum]VAZ71832.1 hypothetical protein LAUMK15_01017 [Mycobacterium persicum]VAZ88331.1 hypothetical protein LAUMK4_00663 [Mycobacterium persicum]